MTDADLERFRSMLTHIEAKVEGYWREWERPLAAKYAIMNLTAKMPHEIRIAFNDWITKQPSIVIRSQIKTGSRFIFPNPKKFKLSKDYMDQKMHELAIESRVDQNRSYYERKTGIRAPVVSRKKTLLKESPD